MAESLSEDQWRNVLDLSEAVVDLSPQARVAYLESIHSSPDIIQKVLTLLNEPDCRSEAPGRVGTQVGHFIITRFLGRGGVGEVYSAKDTELERTVALKFLVPEAIELHGALERFIREARTASALNHPNIVTIYEVIRSEKTVAIAMELVEGQALRHLCGRPLPVHEVVRIGLQIGRALTAAHVAGIVHRDIKPENIMVGADGSVKVLDFGLAVWIASRGQGENGASSSHMFAGTWRYMSPEQARGEGLTAATDVFSLGLILYELCTGRHPFFADSDNAETGLQSLLSLRSVLPHGLSKLDAAVPKALDSLTAAMLAHDPADRPPARSVLQTLEELERAQNPQRRLRKRVALKIFGVSAVLAAVFAAMTWFAVEDHSHVPPVLEAVPLTTYLGNEYSPSFSPDGRQVAFVWNGKQHDNFDVYVKRIGSSRTLRLTNDPAIDYSPAWSPDGSSIAFCRGTHNQVGGAIWIVPALGGPPQKLVDLHSTPDPSNHSISWSPDGKWLVIADQTALAGSGGSSLHGLSLLNISTRKGRQLTRPIGGETDVYPAVSPRGDEIAFTRDSGKGPSAIYLLPFHPDRSGPTEPQMLNWRGFEGTVTSRPAWVPSGKELVFESDRGGSRRLWFGPVRQEAEPRLLSSLGDGLSSAAISLRGQLAYVHSARVMNIWKTCFDGPAIARPNNPVRIVSSTRTERTPTLSPDGKSLAFVSDQSGYDEIWRSNLDGSDTVQLTELQRSVTGSPSWSPDGTQVAFDTHAKGEALVYAVSPKGGAPRQLVVGPGMVPSWSPDGRWVYFSSIRSGSLQVWRAPVTGGTPEQVTKLGGFAPKPSVDGKLIYYMRNDSVLSALLQLDMESRQETEVAPLAFSRAFAPTSQGLYYFSGPAYGIQSLHLFDQKIRASRDPFKLSNLDALGLTATQDGRCLFYGQSDVDTDDLKLVQKFWK